MNKKELINKYGKNNRYFSEVVDYAFRRRNIRNLIPQLIDNMGLQKVINGSKFNLLPKGIKRRGKFFVYILECSDGTYYTGYTPDIERRVELHNKGRGAKYTRDRRPVKLVWCKEYKYFKRAFLEEIRIKTLTRKQKEKLVASFRK